MFIIIILFLFLALTNFLYSFSQLKCGQSTIISGSYTSFRNLLLCDYYNRIRTIIDDNIDIHTFIASFSPPTPLLSELLTEFHSFTLEEKKLLATEPRSYNSFGSHNKKIYLKNGNSIFRIVCAHRMRKIIEEKKYKTIRVPHKYIFFMEKNVVCIAENITSTKNFPIIITLEQMKELIEFIDITGFADFNNGNLIIAENNTIYFVDTEIRSFALHTNKKAFNLQCLKRYFMNNTQSMIIDDAAQHYLNDCIAFHINNNNVREKLLSLSRGKDSEHIDYKKVQIWYRLWNQSQLNSDHLYYDKIEYDEYIM